MAVSRAHDWSAHEIWVAFKPTTLINDMPPTFGHLCLSAKPPSANCSAQLLLSCSVYLTGWWWGTSEESFIYILHVLRRGPTRCTAGRPVLFSALCNIDVHDESLAEERLSWSLNVWRVFMRRIMAEKRNSEGLSSYGQQSGSFVHRCTCFSFSGLIKISPWFLPLFVSSLQGASSARQADDVWTGSV